MFEEVPEAEWDRIGAEIAEELHGSSNIAGIHIDIEPHNPAVHKLFAAIKQHTNELVTAAVGAFEEETFKNVDLLVLMGYDLASVSGTPEEFYEVATRLYGR